MSDRSASSAIPRALDAIAILLGAYFFMCYVFIALSRITYDFELEWLEGSIVDQTLRVLEGKPLYAPPSLDYVPYAYTPLYFYVGALFSKLLGVGLFPLRLVSFLSSLGIFYLIGRSVFRQTQSAYWCALGVGLFAATYRASGAWFDIARVDSLCVFLLLAGFYVLSVAESTKAIAASALLFALAYFTKQSAGVVAAGIAAYTLLFYRGRKRPVFAGVFGSLLAVGSSAFHHATDGWYSYYTFELLSDQAIVRKFVVGYWLYDLARVLPVVLCAVGFYGFLLWREGRPRECGLLACFVGSALVASWFGRLHEGGYANVLMPAYLALCLFFPAAVKSTRELVERRRQERRLGDRPAASLEAVLMLLVIAQFCWLFYPVADQIPTEEDRLAGEKLLATIESIEGDVFVPLHGYTQSRVGKPAFVQGMTLWDIFRGGDSEIRTAVLAEYEAALSRHQFAAIISDNVTFQLDEFIDPIKRHYRPAGRLFPNDERFYPVTGTPTRPNYVWVPRASE